MEKLVVPETPTPRKLHASQNKKTTAETARTRTPGKKSHGLFTTTAKKLNEGATSPKFQTPQNGLLPLWAMMSEDHLNMSSEKKTTKKRYWTPEEDHLLRSLVKKHGPRNWKKISSHFANRTDV